MSNIKRLLRAVLQATIGVAVVVSAIVAFVAGITVCQYFFGAVAGGYMFLVFLFWLVLAANLYLADF